MNNKFAFIDCYDSWEKIPYRFPWTKVLNEKKRKKHILRYFPNTVEEVKVAKVEGYHICLPMIKPIPDENLGFLKDIIHLYNENSIDLDLAVLVLDDSLKPYHSYFEGNVVWGEVLGILYIKNILLNIATIKEKHVKIAIIDSDISTYTDFVLDHVLELAKDITVVTENPNRYDDQLLRIYEDLGLAVQIRDKNVQKQIDADVIIRCGACDDKLFYCFKPGSILIDFVSDFELIRNIKIKRKDIKLIYDIEVKYLEETISKDQMLANILCDSRQLRSLYLSGYKHEMLEKIDDILNRYDIRFALKSL